MAINIEVPFQNFVGLDGDALTNGAVYIGIVGTDPSVVANRVPVYWDEALTIPAAQPLLTNGGYIIRSGSPARIYASDNYSIMVRDQSNVIVYYLADVSAKNMVTLDYFNANAITSTFFSQKGIATLPNITALRAINDSKFTSAIVEGYYSKGDGSGDTYALDSADVTSQDNGGTIIVAANGGRWKSLTPKLIDIKRFGAKGDGITDDTIAIRSAFQAWAAASTIDGKSVITGPTGRYLISSTIDLRTMFSAQTWYGLKASFAPNCLFAQTIALFPMIDFSVADGGGFAFCDFEFPSISGVSLGGTGITIRNISDSTLKFRQIASFKNGNNGDGVRFDTGLSAGVYNNLISINAIMNNNIGLLARDSGSYPHGFQGNIVTIGHAFGNRIGVWLLNQSTSNTFNIGSIEASTDRSILDQAGYNIYKLNFNAGDTVEFGTGNGAIDLEGYQFNIVNSGNSRGWVKDNSVSLVPQRPSIPASNTAYLNVFKRPAVVTISGGTVSSITIDGVLTGATSGSFHVPYGVAISFIYTAAPSWVWTFT